MIYFTKLCNHHRKSALVHFHHLLKSFLIIIYTHTTHPVYPHKVTQSVFPSAGVLVTSHRTKYLTEGATITISEKLPFDTPDPFAPPRTIQQAQVLHRFTDEEVGSREK